MALLGGGRGQAHTKRPRISTTSPISGPNCRLGGLSITDIEAFEVHLLSGTRSDAAAVLAAVSGDEEDGATVDLPQQYWTTVAMNARASAKLASLDAQLEEVLTDLGTLITGNQNEELYKTQRAWRTYRTRAMSYVSSEYYGGTMAPLVGAAHGISLTEERIAAVAADLAERKQRTC